MLPGDYALTVYRGDTERWTFVLWADLFKTVPADLTGATAASQIRTRPGGDVVLTLSPVISLPNTIDLVIPPALCAKLPSRAVWDLQLTYPSGDVRTVLSGGVNAMADVTIVGDSGGTVQGPPGPTGPAGPAGPPGPAGFPFHVALFGAIGDGTTDDTAAIQAAIDAAGAAGGGVVKFDALAYKITATLNVGNGTSSGVSSYSSVRLEGVAPPWFPSQFLPGYPVTKGTVLRWRGATNGTMVSINGPLQGWGVGYMALDGAAAGGGFGVNCGTGLKVISASNGYSPQLMIRGCTYGLYSTAVPPFGALTDTSSFRNHYPDMAIGIGWANGAAGVVLTGVVNANTDYNTFENLTIALPTTLSAGQTAYGIYLQAADSNVFIAPHFFNGDPNFPAFYTDYTINADWPSGNAVIHPDWGNILAPFEYVGTPSANAAPTIISGVNQANNAVYPHDVPNISWAAGTVCTYHLAGQTAAIASHPIYTARAAGGLFRVSYYLVVTGGASGGGSITLSFGWQDGINSYGISSLNCPNGPGNQVNGVYCIMLGSSAPVNVTTTFNSVVGATQYEVWVNVERVA